MPARSVGYLTAVATVALTFMAAAATCSPATVPLPTGPPSTAMPAPETTGPDTVAPSPPNSNVSRAAGGSSACMGAVIYRVNALDSGSFKREMCIAVGGVVRVEHLGPGNLSVDPGVRVSCWYEAAITECRLIRTGTVTFNISGVPKVGSFTVLVAEASSPPKPSPACLSASTHNVDASESGPPWPALCVKLDVVLRVENLGPDGFSAAPADAVSCRYEAGVWECRFVKAGLMTITTTRSAQSRSLILVVVK